MPVINSIHLWFSNIFICFRVLLPSPPRTLQAELSYHCRVLVQISAHFYWDKLIFSWSSCQIDNFLWRAGELRVLFKNVIISQYTGTKIGNVTWKRCRLSETWFYRNIYNYRLQHKCVSRNPMLDSSWDSSKTWCHVRILWGLTCRRLLVFLVIACDQLHRDCSRINELLWLLNYIYDMRF